MSVATKNRIIAGPTLQHIVPAFAADRVVARAADDRVAMLLSFEQRGNEDFSGGFVDLNVIVASSAEDDDF